MCGGVACGCVYGVCGGVYVSGICAEGNFVSFP